MVRCRVDWSCLQRALPAHGYSLVELMVVLVLASIVMSIGVPAMTAMLNTQRASSLCAALMNSLNLARAEAIKRNVRTVLCKSVNGLVCSANGGWEQGWIVFNDSNNNAALDADETLIQQQARAVQGLTLSGNAPVADYVSYSASGSAKLLSGAFQAGTFTLCLVPASGADVRQIVLSKTGRARLIKGSATDCA